MVRNLKKPSTIHKIVVFDIVDDATYIKAKNMLENCLPSGNREELNYEIMRLLLKEYEAKHPVKHL